LDGGVDTTTRILVSFIVLDAEYFSYVIRYDIITLSIAQMNYSHIMEEFMMQELPGNITISDQRTDEDYKFICDQLYKYNVERTSGPRIDISFVMKDETKIIGACFCNTFSNCLYIDVMWLDEAYRGRGYGKLMISQAEKVGKENGCVFSHTTTFNYQSPEFYQACGYEVFSEIREYPGDIVQYFLKKIL